jgi:hypothetical protein
MNRLLAACPVCNGKVYISEISCQECDTRVHGSFEATRFSRLSEDHLEFIELFLKSRGNLSSVAEELEISFPTVSKRLDTALIALGLAEGTPGNGKANPLLQDSGRREEERNRVIEMLDRGEISAEEATRRLRDI